MKKLVTLIALNAAIAASLSAEPLGSGFTYQGRLVDGGTSANGNYDMIFNLYDAPTNGNVFGTFSIFAAVPVSNGVFTVELNKYGEFGTNAFNGQARWLGVGVRTNSNNAFNNFVFLDPRQPLGATPQAIFALQSMNANNAATATFASSVADNSITMTKLAPGTLNWSNIAGVSAGPGLLLGSNNQLQANFASNGNANTVARGDHSHFGEAWLGSNSVGGLAITNRGKDCTESAAIIGDIRSANGIGVLGVVNATNCCGGYGVAGRSYTPFGIGVYGWGTADSNGPTIGVWGQSDSPNGDGVQGYASAIDGDGVGVSGKSAAHQGVGVEGLANASTGVNYGVSGQTYSSSGYGVLGKATSYSGNTFGVRGESSSTAGRAVSGLASATSGTTIGVAGESKSGSGQGVNGLASALAGYTTGVSGQSDSTSGTGIRGLATASSGTTAGVRGETYSSAGVGVEARNNYGVAFKASGTGVIQSDADSYFMVPGSSGSGFYNTEIWESSILLAYEDFGHDAASIPLTLPQMLYGQNTVIKSLEIFYDCWDNTKGFITNTVVNVNTYYEVLRDPAQHKSNSFSSYTLTFNPPLAAMPNGFLSVHFDTKITDGGGIVEIYGIKARLGHD